MIAFSKAEREKIQKSLKPCPFCGNEEIEFNLLHPQYIGKPNMANWCTWEVLCPVCGINNQTGVGADTDENWEKAKMDLIAMWNERFFEI